MTALRLYDIPADVRQVGEECDICHGEFVDVLHNEPCPACSGDQPALLERQLAPLRGAEIRMTALRLSRRVCEFEAEAKVLREHAAAIADRAAKRENTVRFLKDWIQREMEAAGIDKVKDEFTTVYLQDNPASIDVDEEKIPRTWQRATLQLPISMVPPDLTDMIVKVDVLKTPIKEHFAETGELPPGVIYHRKGETRGLRIRS